MVLAACVPENKLRAVIREISDVGARNELIGADMKRVLGFTVSIILGGVIRTFLS